MPAMISAVSFSPAVSSPFSGDAVWFRRDNAPGSKPGAATGSDPSGSSGASVGGTGGDPDGKDSAGPTSRAGAAAAGGLTAEERAIVAKLQQTDRQVRAHEQAHLAAAGGLARGVSFTYASGPDGQQYAVGGEVGIDTSEVSGDPEATIQKAQQIRAAASAPADPSGQDRAVAAQASSMEQAARLELATQQREEQQEQNRRQLEAGNRARQAQSYALPDEGLPAAGRLSLLG